MVQLHDATTLHFDLRIQLGDVLRSWAVPKGPSLDPAVRRLAVPVDDHTLDAGGFEGVYAGARRGSGAVVIWDEGTVEIHRDEPEHLSFRLDGSKLHGGFALTKTGDRSWILIKIHDDDALSGLGHRRRAACQRSQRQDLAGGRGGQRRLIRRAVLDVVSGSGTHLDVGADCDAESRRFRVTLADAPDHSRRSRSTPCYGTEHGS